MPTPRQVRSLEKLVEFLTVEYGIEPQHVIAHCDAPNASTQCCGKRLYSYLNVTLRPELKSGFYAHADR
jgi:hypothetical protein